MHSLLRYISLYAEWKPHIVIIIYAFNDIFQASEGKLTNGKFKNDFGHFFGALGRRVNPKDEFSKKVTGILTGNWLVRNWYSDFREKQLLPEYTKTKPDLMVSLDSYNRNMRNLISRIRQDGAIPVAMTQPFIYSEQLSEDIKNTLMYRYYYREYQTIPTIKEQTQAMRTFNESTRSISSQYQVDIIDLEPLIRKESELMYDDIHYTKLGAEIVAEQVFIGLPWSDLLMD